MTHEDTLRLRKELEAAKKRSIEALERFTEAERDIRRLETALRNERVKYEHEGLISKCSQTARNFLRMQLEL